MGLDDRDIAGGKSKGMTDAAKPEDIGAGSTAVGERVHGRAGFSGFGFRAGRAPPRRPAPYQLGLACAAFARPALATVFDAATIRHAVGNLQVTVHAG